MRKNHCNLFPTACILSRLNIIVVKSSFIELYSCNPFQHKRIKLLFKILLLDIGLHIKLVLSVVKLSLLRTLELTYPQVWYIIGIVSSSPTDFHSEKIGLIRVTYDPLSVLGLINIIVTYTQVWYIIGIVSSSPTDFHSEKIGLISVTNYLSCQY